MEIVDLDSKFSMLDTYGEYLNKKNFITNPAIGRDEEIKEMILILLTPEKSALLIGKAGIGKTAVVEGLGYKMQRGEVPDAIKDYDLIKVNITSLMGNVSTNGNDESKLQLLVDELKTKENIILFIDEIHLLVSRNTSNLNMDFANMLKPGLDRGTIKMIGATTTDEYESYILRDRAFLRRFLKVDIIEPSKDDVVKILMGTYPKYEKHSGVSLSYTDFYKEKIFKFIVEMTDEYKRVYEIGNRYPDIALTVLANAFSNATFENRNVLQIKDVYDAIKASKNIYEDVKIKEIANFKIEFKELIEEEKAELI
ncbi:MAG: AAA family ATPase [Bacilli bacterium]